MNAMTHDAFRQLKEYIHFVDSDKLWPRSDSRWNPLQKIKPVLDVIIRSLQKCGWSLGQTICIDESMVKYKGKFVSFVQYMIAKPIKHGIKIFALCCSETGYLFNFEIYLGKEHTTDGSPTEVVKRLLRGAHMAAHGAGRTLYTDNWYTNATVMAMIHKEFNMSMLGTYTPTKKKSRTADDFPFHKLTNGALRRVQRGWMRAAYQNVFLGGSRPAYTMQATIWKDKKQVGLLHNFDVKSMEHGTHYVERWSPRKKRKREVESPTAITTYTNNYNGVDKKDRDTADWGVSLKSERWYLRVFFWAFDSVTMAMFLIAKHMGTLLDDEWHLYTKHDGRAEFQLHLGHALISAGIKMDCPNPLDLKEKEKRPPYMRRTAFEPCHCNICFFCKNGLTRGVAHAQAPGMPRFLTSEHLPPSPAVPPPPPNQHNDKRVNLGKGGASWCVECKEKLTPAQRKLTAREQRRQKLIKQSRYGCLQCNAGRGAAICTDCWPNYKHNL